MPDESRVRDVRSLLLDHLASPSLRQVRDGWLISLLAEAIVMRLDSGPAIWRKWTDQREEIAKAAKLCWIPLGDLTDHLNAMGGQTLTRTDVAQRLRAFCDEEHDWPNEDLKTECLALYAAEAALGTEMRAIIGALQEFIEQEETRRWRDADAARRQQRDDERAALEQAFLLGAECKWTPVRGSKTLYCRTNGRAFSLTPTPEKLWELRQIKGIEDDDGRLVGRYRVRGDAHKAMATLAG